MLNGEKKTTIENVHFSYQTGETKYYLLTGGSGYPLADFYFPNLSRNNIFGVGLVVPENIPNTSNLPPGCEYDHI